jgi:hypothetical protein
MADGIYLGDSIVGRNCYCGKSCGTIESKGKADCKRICSRCKAGVAGGGKVKRLREALTKLWK